MRDLRRLVLWQTCIEACPAFGQPTRYRRRLLHMERCPDGRLRRAIRELDGTTKVPRV